MSATVYLTPRIKELLTAYASERNISLTQAASALIAVGLHAASPDSYTTCSECRIIHPVIVTKADRV